MPQGVTSEMSNHFAHPLLRARDWQDRPEFDQLCDWWRAGGAGVCALVGIGGAGKTAIADRFLRSLPGLTAETAALEKDTSLSAPGATFVFSFYDTPNPDTFFREITVWLTGESNEADGLTPSYEQTRRLLAKAPRCLLVLDGLEKSQDDGLRGGCLGRITDGRLRSLVEHFSEGLHANVRVIVTTRFAMAEIEEETPPNFLKIRVEEISEETAIDVIRGRVHGTEDELRRIVRECGCHALTVDLVGNYIKIFWGGNPNTRLDIGTLEELQEAIAKESNPQRKRVLKQEFRFARVAQRYSDALQQREPATLALLQRFCLFRLGITGEILTDIFTGNGKEVIATPELAKLSRADLEAKLERLVDIGLLEAEPREGQSTIYAIHPAVRDGFLQGLDKEVARQSHAAVIDVLAIGLPENLRKDSLNFRLAKMLGRFGTAYPSDPEILDLLEEILNHALLAGHTKEAGEIYWYSICGSENLVHRLGAYERGDRLCRAFFESGALNSPNMSGGLSESDQVFLVNDWAHYLLGLGRLQDALRCSDHNFSIRVAQGNWTGASTGCQGRAEVLLLTGRLLDGLAAAKEALRVAILAADPAQQSNSYALRGRIHFLHGESKSALRDFAHALCAQHQNAGNNDWPLYSNRGYFHTLSLARMGNNHEAQHLTQANKDLMEKWIVSSNYHESPCNLVLASLACERGEVDHARSLLASAYDWGIAHDAKEVLCWSALVRSEIELTLAHYQTNEKDGRHVGDNTTTRDFATNFADLARAREAIDEGLRMARDCGYGIYHIDLLLLRAQVALYEGAPAVALDDIRIALDDGVRSDEANGRPELIAAEDPECGYAWGIALGYHLRAEALLLRAAQILGQQDYAPARFDAQPKAVRKDIDAAREILGQCIELRDRIQDPKVESTKAVVARLDGGILTDYRLTTINGGEDMKDFFVSYNDADKSWAEWIAWTLEEAGYTVIIQAWDFRAGNNFVLEMDDADQTTKKTVAVLSDNYLEALYTQSEWAAAFADDPTGKKRQIIPFRVAECKPKGLWTCLVYQDLVGLTAGEARSAILAALKERGKPDTEPDFPGSGPSASPQEAVAEEPIYPPDAMAPVPAQPRGVNESVLALWKEKLAYFEEQEAIVSDPAQKFALKKQIEEAKSKILAIGG